MKGSAREATGDDGHDREKNDCCGAICAIPVRQTDAAFAPIPAVRSAATELLGSTQSGHCASHQPIRTKRLSEHHYRMGMPPLSTAPPPVSRTVWASLALTIWHGSSCSAGARMRTTGTARSALVRSSM